MKKSTEEKFAFIVIPADTYREEEPSSSPSDTDSPRPDSQPLQTPTRRRSDDEEQQQQQPAWDMIPNCAAFTEYIFDGFTSLDRDEQRFLLQVVGGSSSTGGGKNSGTSKSRDHRACGFHVTAGERGFLDQLLPTRESEGVCLADGIDNSLINRLGHALSKDGEMMEGGCGEGAGSWKR